MDSSSLVLKLCDFGSAKKLVKNESNVSYICSRFYRAPELIFGATEYTTAIDMWSVGCVLAEMVVGTPLFTGENAVDQLVEIIKVLGTPSKSEILDMNKHCTDFNFPIVQKQLWQDILVDASAELLDFIAKLLTYSPAERLDPLSALSHSFFDELREATTTLPNGEPLPALFNFSPTEVMTDPERIRSLIPLHARNASNWPIENIVKIAQFQGEAIPTVIYKLHHPFNVIAESHNIRLA